MGFHVYTVIHVPSTSFISMVLDFFTEEKKCIIMMPPCPSPYNYKSNNFMSKKLM